MILALCFFVLWLLPQGTALADPPKEKEVVLSVSELQNKTKALDEAWVNEKKRFQKRFEELISKVERSIEEHEKATDAGDAKFRAQLTEERKDLERQRDFLKRRLAEVSAANFVDWSKLRENIHDKIEDLKD